MTAQPLIPDEVACLAPFVAAGIFELTDIHATATFAKTSGETSVPVLLATALAVRAPRLGHVCVELSSVAQTVVSSIDSPVDSLVSELPGAHQNRPDDTSAHGVGEVVDLDALPWPDPGKWARALSESALVAMVPESSDVTPGRSDAPWLKPLILDGDRLFLSRYWYQERFVAADLVHRSRAGGAATESERSAGSDMANAMLAAEIHVRRLFGVDSGGSDPTPESDAEPVVDLGPDDLGPDMDQLVAALAGLRRDLAVISGGPGTGKTTTVARFLAGLFSGVHDVGADLQIALAAPTGKAAARMTESIRGAIGSLGDQLHPSVVESLQAIEATTIHRLLGSAGTSGFRHGPENHLAADLVIVDEVSMVPLSLMAHLLSAVRPSAKVVLVGDPYQLASVESGVVLGDMVGVYGAHESGGATGGAGGSGPPAAIRSSVRSLRKVHRQAEGSPILELAGSVRQGDQDAAFAILRRGLADLKWIQVADGFRHHTSGTESGLSGVESMVVDSAFEVVDSAANGDIEAALRGITATKVLCGQRVGPSGVAAWNKLVEDALRARGLIGWDPFYAGRPVMVTENDYLNNVFNGDVGVAMPGGGHYQVWFDGHGQRRMIEAARLDRITTQWAMTIHKSQGSEFPHVIVSLPPSSSRILTRELIYTAVTRAKSQLTIISSEEAIRAAIGRPVTRSTGLGVRLERAGTDPESLFVDPV